MCHPSRAQAMHFREKGFFCRTSMSSSAVAAAQAVTSKLKIMAAVIVVQDSLQDVGPQLWFLQSLLGHAVEVIHTLLHRTLQHFSPQNQGLMHYYMYGVAQYCGTTALEPGQSIQKLLYAVYVTAFLASVCMI